MGGAGRSPDISTDSFVPGSRWISATESDLGLGTILRVSERRAEVHFGATGETRVYALDSAPLTRVQFSPGDTITDVSDASHEVLDVEDDNGLLIYHVADPDGGSGARTVIVETSLSDLIQFTDARARLFAAQVDNSRWFDLRVHTHSRQAQALSRPAWGLAGARIEPVPHQLYIADEVSRRHAPRVLLADEVGLGKTIEACLILHRQILAERVQRALIVVPQSLVNQWLVELRRRFNLNFSIYDSERLTALGEEDPDLNPFEAEQLVLTGMDFFLENDFAREAAMSTHWDMLIVDEAHHLGWSENQPGDAYSFVEQLSTRVPGVLLLTATPEQLGEEGHFARLRLLDPNRFHSLAKFRNEQARYRDVSRVADRLLRDSETDDALRRDLSLLLDADAGERATDPQQRGAIVRELIDRHGTSRVMFRNTRAAIPGFPRRIVIPHPLDDHANPDEPRINWLIQLLASKPGVKFLVIAAKRETIVELEEAMRVRAGVRSAVFHEDMSLINRDRAAAWFADPEDGAQVLLASEIGSEGRNFQFASNLVLFDLPLNPDLVEQRIGRLDRIGQQRDVEIHVPFVPGTRDHVLFRWYHDGLGALEHSLPVGNAVLSDIGDAFHNCLDNPGDGNAVDMMIDATASSRAAHVAAIEAGRDRLLEIASFDRSQGETLGEAISQCDADDELQPWLERVFDLYGVESEDDGTRLILRPGGRMEVDDFPGVPDEGVTCCFDRTEALAKEDQAFLTAEHPIARDAMDMVIRSERGRSAMVALPVSVLPSGTILLETLYRIEVSARGFSRFRHLMPSLTRRILIDTNGRDLTRLIGSRVWPDHLQDLDLRNMRQLLAARRDVLRRMLEITDAMAAKALAPVQHAGSQAIEAHFEHEIERLGKLARSNPNVRVEESGALVDEAQFIIKRVRQAPVRLDAIRVHVVP